MEAAVLDQMKAIDPARLTQAVRKDLKRPAFEIRDWTVRTLNSQGIINPEGLFLFQGSGMDLDQPGAGLLDWGVVVKNFVTPPAEAAPHDLWYWKREVCLFQSGLLERLPGPARGPASYGVFESETGWQIWMEYAKDESPARWTLDHYRLAARALGCLNARCYLDGIPPAEPWMSRELPRSWLDSGDAFLPDWREYKSPSLQQAITREDFLRAVRLNDLRERFFEVLNRLPHVFAHNDAHRRNLIIRKNLDGQDEVVLLDWAMAGLSPLGSELYALIGASASLNEVEPEDLPKLEEMVLAEYLDSLQEAGWTGDQDAVRLAYTATIALWYGAAGPPLTAFWTHPGVAERVRELYGCEQVDLGARMGKLCRFGLSRGEEALARIERGGY
jgi:hypothetical protein